MTHLALEQTEGSNLQSQDDAHDHKTIWKTSNTAKINGDFDFIENAGKKIQSETKIVGCLHIKSVD